jgi:hypothetical protein
VGSSATAGLACGANNAPMLTASACRDRIRGIVKKPPAVGANGYLSTQKIVSALGVFSLLLNAFLFDFVIPDLASLSLRGGSRRIPPQPNSSPFRRETRPMWRARSPRIKVRLRHLEQHLLQRG